MKTVIIGASDKPDRYAFQAAQMLQNAKFEFVPMALRSGTILGIDIVPIASSQIIENVHTITLYVNSSKSTELTEYILSLNPQRIIFNPGAENPTLMKLAESKNIDCIEACTLVLIATGQY